MGWQWNVCFSVLRCFCHLILHTRVCVCVSVRLCVCLVVCMHVCARFCVCMCGGMRMDHADLSCLPSACPVCTDGPGAVLQWMTGMNWCFNPFKQQLTHLAVLLNAEHFFLNHLPLSSMPLISKVHYSFTEWAIIPYPGLLDYQYNGVPSEAQQTTSPSSAS